MATKQDLEHAIGCLSVAFPQYVAKEIADLTDQIVASAQTITDPLAAIGALNIQSVVDSAATLSEGSIWENLGTAAAGLAGAYLLRETSSMFDDIANEYPSVSKRSQQIANLGGKVATTGMMFLSLFSDMPYAAAQRLAEILTGLVDMKVENLRCLSKHIRQLVNCVALVVDNFTTHKETTFTDLDAVAVQLAKAESELLRSRRLFNGATVFDSKSFERARQAMEVVDAILTPARGDTSILDVGSILAMGSLGAADRTTANYKLCHLVIPQLVSMVEVEIAAVGAQTDVINFHLYALGRVLQEYRSSATSSRTKEMRDRTIREILAKVQDLHAQVDAARGRQSLRAASVQMMLWASRTKSTLALMQQVKDLALVEGSPDGPDKALVLHTAFTQLLTDIQAINNTTTVAGVEDVSLLRTKVTGIAKGAQRVLDQIDDGHLQQDDLRTFHAQASQLALAQTSIIEQSISACLQIRNACSIYMEFDIGVRPRFEDLLHSMNQIGLDRAADLLGSGKFSEFMSLDMSGLSYLGTMINCLTDTIQGIDDAGKQKELSKIRDALVGKQTNQYVSAADSVDGGRERVLTRLKDRIEAIQKNAKAVSTIADSIKKIAYKAGVNVAEAAAAATMFSGNLDHLAVGAGGRLSADLEEFAKHPKMGVPLC